MITSMLVSGAVRASAVLLLALVACAALSRASAAARRAVLVVALAASMVVPVVAAFGPSWRVEAPAALGVFAHESQLEGVAPGGSPSEAPAPASSGAVASSASVAAIHVELAHALLVVWLVGALALFARAVASQLRAGRLARTGDRALPSAWMAAASAAIRDAGVDVDVRICDGVDSPAVTGVLRSTVLLPRSAESWSPSLSRIVLLHELAHVRRRDALAQLVADAACALHWFNPLAWFAAARLRVERELAADDAVLASGVRPSSYAEELLAVAGLSTAGALAMAERTTLGDRVVAILAAGRSRAPLAARGTTLLVAGSVAVGAAAACASPAAPPRPATTSSAEVPRAAESLDPVAQAAADEVLASVAKEWSAESAVVLVLDAATGEILADAGRVGDHPFDFARSRAITPGSTLKPIVIAAALETSAITSTQLFECGPSPRVYGSAELHDSTQNGTLDAAHLLAVSSNVGTSRIFDALGGDRLATWLTRFHFAEAPQLEGATTGAFPATITTGTRAGAEVALGEGTTATPLQMAAAYAAIANDGVYHAPTTARVASPGERLVSSSTASQVMAMLDTAVTDATATGKLARVDGVHVAGKTGTASFTGADGHEHLYASFIGIADLPAHRVVALVGVETLRDDVWGGAAAAPAFARLVARLR
jgi:beta-lactamase regulating signal transducer with metallopeptidase domain